MEVNPLQYLKSWDRIEETELGMVTEVKLLQPEKAPLPIELLHIRFTLQ
jgi:hypothetical protein